MSRFSRIWHSIYMLLQRNGGKKADYIRKHEIFDHVGASCRFSLNKIPLYPKLIRVHDNVRLAANVTFVTHDTIDGMLRTKNSEQPVQEKLGCIEIMDNVFIGTNTTIMYNTRIGSNVVVAAGSVVTKDLPDNGVYGGAPARYLSSFEDLEKQRYAEYGSYPVHLKATRSSDIAELSEVMWAKFEEERSK